MTAERRIRLGTRGSRLALWQAEMVRSLINRSDPQVKVELVIVKTRGDRDQRSSLASLGGEGQFTRELQLRLLDGDVDAAVHSCKDLPTAHPAGLRLGAVPPRGPVEDAFVGRSAARLAELPSGGRVATGSPRRRAQLLRLRPDLDVVGVRGNVPTRVEKMASCEFDGLILARAGLERLGLADCISEIFNPAVFMPAVGQGAVAVESRADDPVAAAALALIDHQPSRLAVVAERALLATLEAGCHMPVGAYATVSGDSSPRLTLQGLVIDPEGKRVLSGEERGPSEQAETIGRRLAENFLERGAADLLAAGH